MVSAIRRRIPPEDVGCSTATLVNLVNMVNLVNWPFTNYESGPAGRATLWLTDMQSIAYWRFMLACWLTYWYFNIVSNIVNKKMSKKQFFLLPFFLLKSELYTL